jgi:Lysyl oxidase
MRRRPLILSGVIGAAACAAAIPIVGLAAPSSGLPDLRSDAPENPGLEASGGRLLLRFDGFVTNVGQGPLDITGNPSVTGGMQQRINQDGTWTVAGTPLVRYETADGHNHFHLMNAMRYSLWTADRRAEVAPAHKVGFCLYDLDFVEGAQTIDDPVYAPVNFCRRGEPNATELTMGVSAGWRDVYDRNLALQWVDVSSTAPGEYQVAAESDPLDQIEESDEGNNGRAYLPFTIPGHVARAVGPVAATTGRSTWVTLAADAFGAAGARAFRVESAPSHGRLDVAVGQEVDGDRVLYTPDAGYQGPDSFSFSALTTSGDTAGFPNSPTRATASLQIGAAVAPSVAISGAPARMVAGTSARLSAAVTGAGGGVTWTTTGGAVQPDGLFTAPPQVPPGGVVRVRATSVTDPAATAEVAIAIDPVPAAVPAVGSLPTGTTTARARLSRPSVTRSGRTIVVRTVPGSSGTLKAAAIRRGKAVARCRVKAVSGRRAVCRLKLPVRFAGATVRVAITLAATDGTRATARLNSRPRR